MSLVEVMVTAALTAVVGLLATSSLLLLGKVSSNIQHSADVDHTHYMLSSMLPIYLGQAINVDWTTGNIGNLGAGARGLLRRDNWNRAVLGAGADPDPIPVGLFLRETGRPSAVLTTSDIRATAFYYRPPTPTASGRLFITTSGPGTGNAVLRPEDAQQFFDNIVEFQIRPTGLNPDQAVRVAQVRVVYRKFLDSDRTKAHWCPQAQITSNPVICRVRAPFRDIERIVNVALPNNSVNTNFGGASRTETLFGDVYFFRMGMRP